MCYIFFLNENLCETLHQEMVEKNKIGSLIATRENTIPGNNGQSIQILRVYLEM